MIPLIPCYWSPEFVSQAHSFDSTRKQLDVYDALRADTSLPLAFREPEPVTTEQLHLAHDPRYVEAVRTGQGYLARSSGLGWCPATFGAVSRTNGGVVAAAGAALERGVAVTLSSGYHHAEYDRGMGFCTFNGLVIAARQLHAEGKVKRVVILDLDHHFGNGQVEIIERLGLDWLTNLGIHHVADNYGYFAALRKHLAAIAEIGPDLVLFQAGMDPHEDDALGGVRGMTDALMERRDRMVFEQMHAFGIPVAVTLAGGYSGGAYQGQRAHNPVVDLHVRTIREAVRVYANARDYGHGAA